MTEDRSRPDINTKGGMLWHLLCRNKHGMWFVRVDERYLPLPRWMWGHCQRVLPDAEVIQ